MKLTFNLTLVIALLSSTACANVQDVTVAAAAAPSLALPTCDYGAPHPDAPAELAQFSFLVGDYTIAAHAWTGEGWTPPRPGVPARWNGHYVLGGMAIEDEWFDRDPGIEPDTPRGINVRIWDEEADEWDMMWFHTSNTQVQDLRAKIEDGRLMMWQIYPERPNFRAYFTTDGPDKWERITQAPDGEGGWKNTFKLVATRIACAN